jgi:hypothetical protein
VNAIHYFPASGGKGDWPGVLCLVALVVGAVLGSVQAAAPTRAAHLRRWREHQIAAGGPSAPAVARVRVLGIVAALACLALLVLILTDTIHV